MKTRTLEDRIQRRVQTASWTVRGHIVAELQLVARQVRKLYRTQGQFYSDVTCGSDATCVRLKDVLALLKEARR